MPDALRDRARLAEGRVAAPSAAIMDSQSARAAETVGRATRGRDGGKKVQGRKRHIVADTVGFLSAVLVTPASTQDRVAARSLVVEIVQRPDLPYSTVLLRRRVVERTPAWITGHRRCVRDHERLPHHHEAIVRWS